MRVLDIDEQEIELRDMDDEDDDLITVDALTKFAEQQKIVRDAEQNAQNGADEANASADAPLD